MVFYDLKSTKNPQIEDYFFDFLFIINLFISLNLTLIITIKRY